MGDQSTRRRFLGLTAAPDWIARIMERFDGRSGNTANVGFVAPRVTESAMRRFGPDRKNDRLREP